MLFSTRRRWRRRRKTIVQHAQSYFRLEAIYSSMRATTSDDPTKFQNLRAHWPILAKLMQLNSLSQKRCVHRQCRMCWLGPARRRGRFFIPPLVVVACRRLRLERGQARATWRGNDDLALSLTCPRRRRLTASVPVTALHGHSTFSPRVISHHLARNYGTLVDDQSSSVQHNIYTPRILSTFHACTISSLKQQKNAQRSIKKKKKFVFAPLPCFRMSLSILRIERFSLCMYFREGKKRGRKLLVYSFDRVLLALLIRKERKYPLSRS